MDVVEWAGGGLVTSPPRARWLEVAVVDMFLGVTFDWSPTVYIVFNATVWAHLSR